MAEIIKFQKYFHQSIIVNYREKYLNADFKPILGVMGDHCATESDDLTRTIAYYLVMERNSDPYKITLKFNNVKSSLEKQIIKDFKIYGIPFDEKHDKYIYKGDLR